MTTSFGPWSTVTNSFSSSNSQPWSAMKSTLLKSDELNRRQFLNTTAKTLLGVTAARGIGGTAATSREPGSASHLYMAVGIPIPTISSACQRKLRRWTKRSAPCWLISNAVICWRTRWSCWRLNSAGRLGSIKTRDATIFLAPSPRCSPEGGSRGELSMERPALQETRSGKIRSRFLILTLRLLTPSGCRWVRWFTARVSGYLRWRIKESRCWICLPSGLVKSGQRWPPQPKPIPGTRICADLFL